MEIVKTVMTLKRIIAAGSLIAVVFVAGCTNMKYMTHLDTSIKTAKVPASTIAVFPIDKLDYRPPSGCSGSGIAPESQSKYQDDWNKRIASSITMKFPNQKFVFLKQGEGVLAGGEVDMYGISEQSKRASRAQQINSMLPDSTIYEPMITSSEMQTWLKKVAESTLAQYALVFVAPGLSGEVQTSYSAGPYGGGASSSTVYVADVQALVWECSTGRLLFSSGGWGSGSSSCFFLPPQGMAIDAANSKFEKNLMLLLTRLMKHDAAKRYATTYH